jgi:phage tail-like protein
MADATTEPAAAPGVWIDPYRAYSFKLDIGGVTQGHFTECGGLSVKIVPIRYREGGERQIVHHVPGPIEYGPVTLRYGLTESREMWDWLLTGVEGRIERKNISIVMLDVNGDRPATRWNLNDAWVSEWKAAPLDALAREVAIESMTLVFDSIQRA